MQGRTRVSSLDAKIKALDKDIKTLQDEVQAVSDKRDKAFESIKELRKQRDAEVNLICIHFYLLFFYLSQETSRFCLFWKGL